MELEFRSSTLNPTTTTGTDKNSVNTHTQKKKLRAILLHRIMTKFTVRISKKEIDEEAYESMWDVTKK